MIKAIDRVKHVQRVKEYRTKYRCGAIESHRAADRLYEKVDRMMQLRQVQDQIESECERLEKEIFDLRIDHLEIIDRVLISREEYNIVQTSCSEHYEQNKHKYKEKKIPAKDFPKGGMLI